MVIRKATWTILLFLLVGAQALATTCAVRCDAMDSMMAAASCVSSEMADCHGLMSTQAESSNGSDIMLADNHCEAHVCQGDLTPLQSRSSFETASHTGPLVGAVILYVRHADTFGIATPLRFDFARRGRFVPLFDPLNSSFRV